MSSGRLALIVAVTAVAAAVGAGIYAIGSPGAARVRQFDVRRVADLQDIQRTIDVRWSRQLPLPQSLDDIASARDPVTDRPYEYRTLSASRYELCAEFSESSTAPAARPTRDFWSHGAGRQCFQIEPRTLEP